jgi:hypothetical protein
LFSAINIIKLKKSKRVRLSEHAAYMAQIRKEHKILVREPEGKRSLGRPRCRWNEDVKMPVTEIR